MSAVTLLPAKTTTDGFAASLTFAVNDHLAGSPIRHAFRRLHRKAVVIALWYVASFAAVVFAHGWIEGTVACTSMALALAGVGFNIQHNANHNAFFDTAGTKRLTIANRVAGWSMYAIGADANRWIYRHGTLHHGSPNIVGLDTDIALGALARFAPAQKYHPWHRYQHIHLWPLYCFTAVELMVRDVTSLVRESLDPASVRRQPSVADYATTRGAKVLFLLVLVGVPALFHPMWIVVGAGAAVLMIEGLILGVIFQSAHVVQEAEFADVDQRFGYRWHEWQVRSSLDFSHGTGPLSRALRWYAGASTTRPSTIFSRVSRTARTRRSPTS